MSEHRQPVWPSGRLAGSGKIILRVLARRQEELTVWADIRAFPPLAAIAALDCVAGLVLWRKLAGGPPLHLTNARLCIAGVSIAVLTMAGRWWLARIERETPALWIRSLLMVLGAAPIIVLLSLANSQHSPWAVSMTSALAVGAGGAALLWNRLPSAPRSSAQPPAVQPATVPFPATSADSSSPGVGRAVPTKTAVNKAGTAHPTEGATAAAAGEKPDEWMERTLDGSGAVTWRGRLQAEFAAGQSVAVVHIPFCPSFGVIPEFTCEIIDAPAVRARSPAVFRYGARVELKRSGDASHPARVAIHFRASATANASRAA